MNSQREIPHAPDVMRIAYVCCRNYSDDYGIDVPVETICSLVDLRTLQLPLKRREFSNDPVAVLRSVSSLLLMVWHPALQYREGDAAN